MPPRGSVPPAPCEVVTIRLEGGGEGFINKGCRQKSFLPKHLLWSFTVPVTFTEKVHPQSHFNRELHGVRPSVAAGVKT